MISDVLSSTEIDIQEYLDHEGTRDCYQGAMRERVERLVAEMAAIREILDTPPCVCDREASCLAHWEEAVR